MNLIPKVSMHLNSVVSDIPINSASLRAYERKQSPGIVQSAKVLYDAAREQILDALLEIDNRIAYWQYQKDHPWNYFVSKNPLKWVTGPAQEDEIETNLETLKSHQGELYVFLGNLALLGGDFNAGYKDAFLIDYHQGYAWVDTLLDILIRIKTKKEAASTSPFLARVQQLQEKLDNVGQLKDELLSDIAETAIPPYLARNWFRGGAILLAMGYGYGYYDPLSTIFLTNAERAKGYLQSTAKDVQQIFFPTSSTGRSLLIQHGNIKEARSAMTSFLEKLYEKGLISAAEKEKIIEDELKGNSATFQTIFNENMKSKWFTLNYGAEGWNAFLQLLIAHSGSQVEKEIAGLRNVALLAPAALVAIGGYSALSKLYQRFITTQLSDFRRALVDINSLFVDPTKPLTDEQVGKMTYLIHMVKRRAEKELPTKGNMRADFIYDLERLESSEFNVAAKRAIVDDMFKKYDFLGLVQKK